MSSEHEKWCKEAIDIAATAVKNGNHPFGALLVVDGEEVARAENTVNTDGDPSCHAETNLIKVMAKKKLLAPEILEKAVFYTSTEPCMMCSGALYWSGVRHVVFASSETALARHAGDDFLCPCADVFARGKRKIVVEGPVMEATGEALHASYWIVLENRGKREKEVIVEDVGGK